SQLTGMQIGPDGKIYIANMTDSIAVINDPNQSGTLCNYSDKALSLLAKNCNAGLPNYISSYFQPPPAPFTYTLDPIYGCQTAYCSPPNVHVSCVSGHSVVAWSWDFGDPQTGNSTFSNLATPLHAFSSYGSYTV